MGVSTDILGSRNLKKEHTPSQAPLILIILLIKQPVFQLAWTKSVTLDQRVHKKNTSFRLHVMALRPLISACTFYDILHNVSRYTKTFLFFFFFLIVRMRRVRVKILLVLP